MPQCKNEDNLFFVHTSSGLTPSVSCVCDGEQKGSSGAQVQGIRSRWQWLYLARRGVDDPTEQTVQLPGGQGRRAAEEVRQGRQRKTGHRRVRGLLRRGQSHVSIIAINQFTTRRMTDEESQTRGRVRAR